MEIGQLVTFDRCAVHEMLKGIACDACVAAEIEKLKADLEAAERAAQLGSDALHTLAMNKRPQICYEFAKTVAEQIDSYFRGKKGVACDG